MAGQDEDLEALRNFNANPPGPASVDIINPDAAAEMAELGAFNSEQEYGGLGSQVATGVESAASTLSFGLSKGLENFVGEKLDIDTLKREAIEGREQENPMASAVGSVGAVAGSLLSGSAVLGAVPKTISKVAEAGAKMIGLGTKAVEAGSALTKVGSLAAKGAIEGALYTASNENAKLLMGDPQQSVSSAAVNVGLSGLLGGVIGGTLGGGSSLWEAKFSPKVTQALDDAAAAIDDKVPSASQAGLTPPQPPKNPSTGLLQSELGGVKDNAYEITHAANRLGIKPSPGMVSDSKLVQTIEGNLERRPTIVGVAQAKEADVAYKRLVDAADDTLKGRSTVSAAEAGAETKKAILEPLKKELDLIESQYKKLKPHLDSLEASAGAKDRASQSVLDAVVLKEVPDAAENAFAKQIADNIKGLKTVTGIKDYRTAVSRQLDAAYRTGAADKVPVLQAARDALTELRARSISDAADAVSAPSAVKLAALDEIKAADTAYRAYKTKLSSLGDEASLGKIGSARKLLEKLEKLPDEKIAQRIFDVKDSGQLNFFRENFPRAFEIARKYRLQEIYENSLEQGQGKNAKFSVQKYLNQLRDDGSKKVGPESLQYLMDPARQQKLQDIRLVFQHMPGNPNPSGTSYALAIGEMFSPAGVVNNLNDTAQYFLLKAMPYLQRVIKDVGGDEAAHIAALKFAASTEKGVNAPAFRAMTEYIRNLSAGEKAMSRAVRSLFFSGIPAVLPSVKSREKLDKKLQEISKNENSLFEMDHGVGHYLPDHEMTVSQMTGNAVAYLNSLRPVAEKLMPMDSEPEVTEMDKQAFYRALDIAESPLIVLNSVKDGSVTADDLKHLKTLYPGLYVRLSDKITNEMMETGESVPYATRMGMSLFLAQPLDSTMTPQAIQATQLASAPQENPQAQVKPSPTGMKDLPKMVQGYQTPGQARQAARSKA